MKIGFFINAFIPVIVITLSFSPINMYGQDNKLKEEILPAILNASPELASVLKNKDSFGIQVIYTQIDRTKKNKAKLTDHHFNLSDTYFYPASTVKLPVAILALQKLNELKIAGLDKNSTMITEAAGDGQTEVWNDPSAADGRPTIEHYIKKILLVSDNDAFNRLYEFLGQEYINNSLHKMGYAEVQIIHRLDIFLSEEQNRHTNPVKFLDTAGRITYQKPAEKSQLIYAERNIKLGNGYMKGEQLVNEPFDFSKKNRLYLQSLHSIVKAVLFPESMPE
ncbi:MAG TPA: serine hydrolase, partial [Chitinophagaceae bacterium]